MTAAEVAEFLSQDREGIKLACERMYGHGYLNVDRDGNKASIYDISRKGRNLLAKQGNGSGQIPGPRRPVSTEPWVPPPPFISRAGAQDFLKHPSRRGDTFVEHKLPISMAGGER